MHCIHSLRVLKSRSLGARMIQFSRGNNSMISPLPFPLYFHFSSLFTLNYGGKKYRKIRRQKFLEISIPFNVERYLTKQTNEQRFKANLLLLLLLLHSFKFCGFSKIPRCFLCFSMHVLSWYRRRKTIKNRDRKRERKRRVDFRSTMNFITASINSWRETRD